MTDCLVPLFVQSVWLQHGPCLELASTGPEEIALPSCPCLPRPAFQNGESDKLPFPALRHNQTLGEGQCGVEWKGFFFFWLIDSTGLIQDYVVACSGVEHCGSGEAALHFFVDRKRPECNFVPKDTSF